MKAIVAVAAGSCGISKLGEAAGLAAVFRGGALRLRGATPDPAANLGKSRSR